MCLTVSQTLGPKDYSTQLNFINIAAKKLRYKTAHTNTEKNTK